VTVALTLARDTRGTLTVHDLAGRLVRTLARGDLAAGHTTHAWNGRDEAGRSLPSGVYLVRLASQDADLRHKIVLME
jgi:flagellar hook assembly protein FlgD